MQTVIFPDIQLIMQHAHKYYKACLLSRYKQVIKVTLWHIKGKQQVRTHLFDHVSIIRVTLNASVAC